MTGNKITSLILLSLIIFSGIFLENYLFKEEEREEIRLEAREERKEEEKEKEEENSCLKILNDLQREDWTLVEGIGEVISKRVMEESPFKRKEDLKEVEGIGEVTYMNIKNTLCKEKVVIVEKEEEENEEKENLLLEIERLENKLKYTCRNPNQVNLNLAKEEELRKVTGEIRAKLIKEARPIENLNQIENIKGDIKEEEICLFGEIEERKILDINRAEKEELKKLGIEDLKEKRPFCSLEELKEEIEEDLLKNIQLIPKEECFKEEEREEVETLKMRIDDLREKLGEKRRNIRDLELKVEKTRKERDICRFRDQININKASPDNLKEVEGVGEVIAKRIKRALPINYLEELKRVEGVGEVIVGNLIDKGFCTKGETEEKQTSIERVEINSASLDDLKRIGGVGEVIAKRIKEERPFSKMSDLTKVEGIGEITLENIKEEGLAYLKEKSP